MLSLLATVLALVFLSVSLAMLYTDEAEYLYPPRFE